MYAPTPEELLLVLLLVGITTSSAGLLPLAVGSITLAAITLAAITLATTTTVSATATILVGLAAEYPLQLFVGGI